MTPLDEFKKRVNGMPGNPTVLLTGAKEWADSFNPEHANHSPNATWIGTDIEAGKGVEIVADLQRIHEVTDRRFDAVFSPATLEHIERPWVAMHSMGQVLKPGGIFYLHTHQTFPIHGYPSDYFRFSTEALRTMCFDSGLDVVSCEYDSPCTITPSPSIPVWNTVAESFLNVTVCAVKS